MQHNFTLSSGLKPEYIIDRTKEFDLITEDFNSDFPINRSYIITGIRGSGKTVLMGLIGNYYSNQKNWIVVNLNSETNMITNLADKLYKNPRLNHLFINKNLNLSINGFGLSFEKDNSIHFTEADVEIMLQELKKHKIKLLITIDEVTSNSYMKEFAQSFQSFVRFEYQIYLIMTGIYSNISILQDNKSLTFLYRTPKIYLGPLNKLSIANKYQSLFNISLEEAVSLSNFTKGYAYAFQVLGLLLSKHNETHITSDIIKEFDYILQEYVYAKVWSDLPNKEKEILTLIPETDVLHTKELYDKLNINNSEFSVYRDRLIKKGIITSEQFGTIQMVLPRFSEYIKLINMF